MNKNQPIIVICLIIYSLIGNAQDFTEVNDAGLIGVGNGSIDWGDYNNDGYVDIIITGDNAEGANTKIFKNNGNNTFTEQTGISLIDFQLGSVSWGDYNNDGYLDILITGLKSTGGTSSKVYKNNGDNSFTEQTDIILTGVYNSSVNWGDYNNDGYLDILLTGKSTTEGIISKVYKNNGDNSFTEQTGITITGVNYSSVAWGDYDNDGDLDILLTGESIEGDITKIYKNNGDNSFSEQTSILLSGVSRSSVAWGDYDNDGDLDILLTGNFLSKIYRNNGDNSFTEQSDISLPDISSGSALWGDYDNDGDLDILLTGNFLSKIYRNNGDNSFTEQMDINLSGAMLTDAAFTDIDNDGDLDIYLTGFDSEYNTFYKVYRNNAIVANSVPEIPGNIQSNVNGNSVTLSWDIPIDAETSQIALTYNLQIGSSSGISDINSVMTDLNNGFRKIVKSGAVQDTAWTIQNLEADTYYWSVQAIDNNFAGSEFSTEGSFTVTFSNSISPVDEQVLLPENEGTPLNVTETEVADSRQWKYSNFAGGPYNNIIDGETGTTYTPKFSDFGYYFVVCTSTKDGNTIISNEVKISVPHFTEQTTISLEDVGNSSVAWGDYDNDGYLDILLTGNRIAEIYKNNGDNSFTKQTDISLFAVSLSSVAWGDYDNDGDLDILLTGADADNNGISKVYKNNYPINSFTELTDNNITGVYDGSVGWSDYDNDGDLDIILSGASESGNQIFKIYKNSDSQFTDINAAVTPFSDGCLDIGDYDNDGDIDLLLSGTDLSGNHISKIYRNDGDDIFTDLNIYLERLWKSSVVWGDYDNDGDLDILLAGTDAYQKEKTKIYKNNGDDSFIEQTEISLSGVEYGSIAWGDYDNDGLLDILLTGQSSSEGIISKVYKNNGDNSFTEQITIDLASVYDGSVSWGDYDNDGDLDILLTGTYFNDGIQYMSTIYKNNCLLSNNEPTPPTNLTSEEASGRAILSWNKALDDEMNQDGLTYNIVVSNSIDSLEILSPMSKLNSGWRKIVEMGNTFHDTLHRISNLDTGLYYWSVQSIDNNFASSAFAETDSFTILPPFTDINANLIGVSNGDADWGDYDNDGDLDVLITGFSSSGDYFSRIYKNIGQNNFEEQTDIILIDVRYSSVAWGDYDNDNDLDILLSGISSSEGIISKIYKNNGGDSFTEQTDIVLSGVSYGSVAWADYDNDGDLDILLYNTDDYKTKIYKNNGDNSFTEQTDIYIQKLSKGSVAWGDYDNDMNLDLLITGQSASGVATSKIYKNNGNNDFTEQYDISLIGVEYGSAVWGDYDNDGDLDILLAGYDNNRNKITKIYRNDGFNIFTDIDAIIRGVYFGSAAWGDYDNDGDLDILLSGESGTKITEIYRNDGNDIFTRMDFGFAGTNNGSIDWGDYDNDGDLDILITGHGGSSVGYSEIAKIYENNGNWENSRPTSPSNLQSENYGYGILLNWEAAIDEQTSSNGLSYNLRVGTAPDSSNVISPMSDLNSGNLHIPGIGNCQMNLSWYIDSLQQGTYYWSVQGIDNTFLGGKWSEEQSFTITRLRPNFTADTVCFGDSTTFRDTSLFTGTQIESWHWNFGDGNTSIVQHPKNVFESPGKHYVTLTITDTSGVSQSKLDSVFVKQRPEALFSVTDICIGSMASIVNTSEIDTLTINSWRWVFGDEDTVYQQYPTAHPYLNTGTYDIELAILAQNECSDTAIHSIKVGEYPIANIFSSGDPSFCYGDSFRLSVAYNPDYLYEWKIGDAVQEESDSSIYYVQETGDYSVKITNTLISPDGCVSESFESITVEEYPEIIVPNIEALGETIFCEGDSLLLRVYESSVLDFVWKLNGTPVYSGLNEYYVKSGIGSFTVNAIHSTTQCVINSTNSVEVTVNENPAKPVVSLSRTPEFCEGDSVVMTIEEQSGVLYQWVNGNSEIPEANTNEYVVYETGNYYIDVINATTQCSNTSETTTVTVTEMPEKPTVSISNYDINNCPQEKIITLSVNEASDQYTYQWYWNGKARAGATETELSDYLEEGSYSVKAINGLCSNESDDIDIQYIPELPDKPTIEVKGPNVWYLACTNDQAEQYEWYYENEKIQGADEYMYIPGDNMGTYSVRIAEENGCFVSSDAVSIPITGINDMNPFANLKIYPNPTPGVFTIEMDNNLYGELITRIFKQNAVEILNIKFDKTTKHFKAQVDLSGQGHGIYIISLMIDKYKTERKLVVE